MKNKIALWASGVGAAIAGLAITSFAHASVLFSVPTSTAPSLTANVGDQLGDPGTLLVLGIVAGIYLVFYVIGQLIGMIPKKHSGRR